MPHQATVLVSSAAVTNSHRWGGVNSRQWFLTVLEAGSPAGPVSGASPLPGLQMVAVLLYSHGVERQRQEASSVGSVIRTLISFVRPPSQPQSPPGPTSSIPSHWNLGWTPRIWGDTHIGSTAAITWPCPQPARLQSLEPFSFLLSLPVHVIGCLHYCTQYIRALYKRSF